MSNMFGQDPLPLGGYISPMMRDALAKEEIDGYINSLGASQDGSSTGSSNHDWRPASNADGFVIYVYI